MVVCSESEQLRTVAVLRARAGSLGNASPHERQIKPCFACASPLQAIAGLLNDTKSEGEFTLKAFSYG